MHTKSHKQILDFVNRCRKEMKLRPIKKLPKGNRNSSNSCPIANGLKQGIPRRKIVEVVVDGEMISLEVDSGRHISRRFSLECPPKYVEEFINDFDNQRHPDLEK